jgi:DNA-binding response OmpR family regulator
LQFDSTGEVCLGREQQRRLFVARLARHKTKNGAMEGRAKTILIADDEPTVANTVRLILESAGYRTIVAHDGEEAARLIREAGPDAVLLDVILPRIDGVEVAIRACRIAPNCKIILFSGRPDAADLLADARARGYNFEILAKPTRPQELLEKVHELLAA